MTTPKKPAKKGHVHRWWYNVIYSTFVCRADQRCKKTLSFHQVFRILNAHEKSKMGKK